MDAGRIDVGHQLTYYGTLAHCVVHVAQIRAESYLYYKPYKDRLLM